jgi:type II secretory pathway pseudopilin PulG
VELLVVITIMVIMMGLAATMMRPDLDGRRTREAARSVNVYLASARNRAMETGRPVGVIFHRLSAAVPAVLSMDQCEVPPTFAGLNLNSVVRVQDWSTVQPGIPNNGSQWVAVDQGNSTILRVQLRTGPANGTGAIDFPGPPGGVVSYGDRVQLNGQGPWYTVVLWSGPGPATYQTAKAPDFPLYQNTGTNTYSFIDFSQGKDTDGDSWIDGNYLTLRLAPTYPQQTAWPKGGPGATNWSQPVSFSVRRFTQGGQAQVFKGAETPLQLPAGAAIDLDFSGIGNDNTLNLTAGGPPFPDSIEASGAGTAGTFTWFDANWFDGATIQQQNDVTILFNATGGIDSVSVANDPYSPYYPTRPIYLLIGQRERIPANNNFNVNQGNPATWPNWYDLKNIWVVINPQNGSVSTGENGSVAANPIMPTWNDRTTWRQFIILSAPGLLGARAPVQVQCRVWARDVQSMGGK